MARYLMHTIVASCIDAGWHSHVLFYAKVSLAVNSGLKRYFKKDIFGCKVVDENVKHKYLTCPVAEVIRVLLCLNFGHH